jgi:hypothetical protein
MYKMLKTIIVILTDPLILYMNRIGDLKITQSSHQFYSYIVLTDPLILQIIGFSILYMIYLRMAYI